MSTLKVLRRILAAAMLLGLTALLLDATGALHRWLGWMARIQLVPAIMALNAGVILLLAVLTLVFGRIYCSVICPLGVFQDGVSWLRRKPRRFRYSPAIRWLRYGLLALFAVALAAGVQVFVALLAPYSAYGRMVQSLLGPLSGWITNLLADLSARAGTYAVYPREVWLGSLPTLLVAIATLILVVVLAWRGGRTYCNTLCPVGTTLGLLSRFALFRPVIDASKCKDCHQCEHACKASCISIPGHKIDYSRCVDCFNCLSSCKFGALKYRFAYGAAGGASGSKAGGGAASGGGAGADAEASSRRSALKAGALVLAGAAATRVSALAQDDKKRDGGLTELLPRQRPERTVPLTPPGSRSVDDFYRRCTACQLCVGACPNQVLRPSSSLEHLMQPEMGYERGFCRPECTRCSQVCPSGAILPLTPEQKTAVHIGIAVVDRERCVVESVGDDCGNCARHCPAGAILMVRMNPEDASSRLRPAVQEERCLGCGACEYVCPSRPLAAIRVQGRKDHLTQ